MIKTHGLAHSNQPKTVKQLPKAEPPKRNPSPLYWSNDGTDGQFLGEFTSPMGMVISLLKIFGGMAIVIYLVGSFL